MALMPPQDALFLIPEAREPPMHVGSLHRFSLIEGLTDNRFAVYTKLHHAVMDGVSGLRLLQRTLSEDPDDRSALAFWSPRPRRSSRLSAGNLLTAPLGALRGVADLAAMSPTVL